MVDITTGKVLAKKVFDATASALTSTKTPQVGISEFHYAFPSAPAACEPSAEFGPIGPII